MIHPLTSKRSNDLSIEGLWATSAPVRDLPGWFVKRVEVPSDGLAVIQDSRGVMRTLSEGSVVVGGTWHRLTRLFALRAVSVGVMQSRTLTIHPFVTNLLTHDNQLAEADWLLTIRVSEPRAVYSRIIQPEELVTVPTLTAIASGETDYKLRGLVRRYLLEDLVTNPEVGRTLTGELASFLRTYLSQYGLEVVAVSHLVLASMDDYAQLAGWLRALKQRLREQEVRSQMAEIREEHQLREFAAGLAHQAQLQGLFREDELEALARDVQQNIDVPDAAHTELERLLDRKLSDAQLARQGRVAQLARRLEVSDAVGEECSLLTRSSSRSEAADHLRRFLAALRYAGSVLFWGTMLVALLRPGILGDERRIQLIRTAIGLSIAVAGLLSAYLVGQTMKKRHAEELRIKASGKLSSEQRARADRLVRMNLARSLSMTLDRARATKDALLRDGKRAQAADLRQVENRLARFIKQVDTMAPAFASLDRPARLSTSEQMALVDTEEKLLAYADSLENLGSQMHQATQAGQLDSTGGHILEIENAILEFGNMIEHRNRLTLSYQGEP